MSTEPDYARLVAAAKRAVENAYCPYSNYSVGAAILTFDDRTYVGCNVENAAYSQTIHAEETAVASAIADGLLVRARENGLDETKAIKALAVYASKGTSPWPCCNCRQFLSEFGTDFLIVGQGEVQGSIVMKPFKELVPFMFSKGPVLDSAKGIE